MEAYDPSLVWLVVLSFLAAFVLAFGVGANDVANVFGTSVGARAISLKNACIIATFAEVLGSVLLGYKVSDTMRKGIIDTDVYAQSEKVLMLGSLSALAGSAVWNLLASFLRLPISGTHTIVGATVGFSLVARGAGGVNWTTFGKIVGSWFVSPVLSGAISVCLYLVVRHMVLLKESPLEPGLKVLPLFYAVTLFINLFSVLHSGPKLLMMDKLPLWSVLVISLLGGLLLAVIIQVWLVPRLRAQAELDEKTTVDVSDPSSALSLEKLNNGNSAFSENTNTQCLATSHPQPDPEQSLNETTEDEPTKVLASDPTSVSRLFSALQVMTASFGSFAHGGNDVSNAIGPLIAVWLIYVEGSVAQKSETPVYLLLYGGIGITVGLWVWGRRVMKTIGEDLTQLTPSSGFTIELGAAFTVLMASKIGLPISTTHCKVGSVVFVGWAKSKRSGVDWSLFRNIVMAWLVTVPFAAGMSAGIMAILLQVAV